MTGTVLRNSLGAYKMSIKQFRFKKCECLQVTIHHAAYPENVSWFFEEQFYSQDGVKVAVELYSCGCEECEECEV